MNTKWVRWIAFVLTTATVLHCTTMPTVAAGRVVDAIWANGRIYGTVATPAFFKKAPPHSTDIIYSFDGGGLTGQRSVAEAAPGDSDYNGGRWRVMAVTVTTQGFLVLDLDGDKVIDDEITSSEDLLMYVSAGLLTFMDTGIRFECPLLPL
jgi:hypothetical protein